MAWYPKAIRKPLPQNSTQPRIAPRKVILHRAVDNPGPTLTLYGWFTSPGARGAESHFWVRFDGTVEQYMDTEVRADANFDANVDGISVETEDDGIEQPLSAAQVASLIELYGWLRWVHQIPAQLCPGPKGAGFGWHNQFYEWAKDGHACPGPSRVQQLVDVILPAVAGVSPQEDEMGKLILIRDNQGRVFLTNEGGHTATHVPTPRHMDTLKFLGVEDRTAGDSTVLVETLGKVAP